ncbi:MAG: hypothetical protein QXE95_00625 [Candidatus Nitrosocaldus sp.]
MSVCSIHKGITEYWLKRINGRKDITNAAIATTTTMTLLVG